MVISYSIKVRISMNTKTNALNEFTAPRQAYSRYTKVTPIRFVGKLNPNSKFGFPRLMDWDNFVNHKYSVSKMGKFLVNERYLLVLLAMGILSTALSMFFGASMGGAIVIGVIATVVSIIPVSILYMFSVKKGFEDNDDYGGFIITSSKEALDRFNMEEPFKMSNRPNRIALLEDEELQKALHAYGVKLENALEIIGFDSLDSEQKSREIYEQVYKLMMNHRAIHRVKGHHNQELQNDMEESVEEVELEIRTLREGIIEQVKSESNYLDKTLLKKEREQIRNMFV